MNKSKKAMSVCLAVFLLAGTALLGLVPMALAINKPKVVLTKDATTTTFVMVAKMADLAKKKVIMEAVVTNDSTGKVVAKFTAAKTVNKVGRSSIKVHSMKSKIKYRIKFRVRRSASASWSAFSDTKKVTTK